MSSLNRGKSVAAAALVLLPVAVLLAQVQFELNGLQPASKVALAHYLAAPHDLDPIWRARALPRWIINSGLFGTSAASANVLLQTLTAWAALVATWLTAQRFLSNGWPLVSALAVGIFSCWGWLSLGYNATYPYDYPALFFSALGIYGIVAQRFPLVAAVVALGTLNKETTLWLIPAWAAVWLPGRADIKRIALQITLLSMLFLAAYQSTRLTNPQDLSLQRRMLTVSAYTDAARETSRFEANLKELAFAGRGGFGQNIYWPLLIHLPALLFWRRLPRPLQRLYYGAPFLIAPNFIVGNIWEVRIFNELLPLGAVASAWALSYDKFGGLKPSD